MRDWDDLRFFLAVLRHGSLSAAARDLRVMQSTVGRRLIALESRLGARLVTRTPRGYLATTAGKSILAGVERVEAEAHSITRLVGARDVRLEGTVSVTSIGPIASRILAPCFATLHRRHPEIMIELRPDTSHLGLPMREIDVVVRLARLKQHEFIVRRIGKVAFGIYAGAAYLERCGEPDLAAGCPGHQVILSLDDAEFQPQQLWFANVTREARIVLKTSSYEAQLNAVLAGDGIACLARFYADDDERLQRLDIEMPAPAAEIWLATHRDNRRTLRIRAVLDCIMQGIRARVGNLDPSTPSPHHAPNGDQRVHDFNDDHQDRQMRVG